MKLTRLNSALAIVAGIIFLMSSGVETLGQNKNDPKHLYAADILKRATKKVQPTFPPSATAALLSIVHAPVVEVTINEDGDVVAAQMISGCSLLKDAAIEAARDWKFVPPKKEGLSGIIGPVIFDSPAEMRLNPMREPQSYLEEAKAEAELWIAHCRAARAYWWRNQEQKAEEEYKKAISLNPQAAIAYYGLGKIYFEQRQYDKALEFYKQAFQIKPDFVEAVIAIGWTFGRLKRTDQSIEAFNQAIKISPNLDVKEIAYTNIASNYKRIGKTEVELDIRKQLLNIRIEKRAIDPRLESEFGIASEGISLAGRYRDLGRYREAIEIYQKNIEIYPLSGTAWESYFGMADCYEYMGDNASAMKVYEKLLGLTDQTLRLNMPKEREGSVYQGRGLIYERMKRDKEAIESYQKAAKLKPKSPEPHIALRRIYLKIGDEAAAERETGIIQKLEEDTARALREPK